MASPLAEFEKKALLNQGAVCTYLDGIYVFWGAFEDLEKRPADLALYRPGFWLSERKPWRRYEHVRRFSRGSFGENFKRQDQHVVWLEPNRKNYQDLFQIAQETFRTGVRKVVAYTVEHGTRSAGETFQWVEHLLASGLQYQVGSLYGEWGSLGGFIGLTPELLLEQHEDKVFSTMALAGTLEKSSYMLNPSQLTENPHLLAEQSIVSEELLQELLPLGRVKMKPLTVELTPSLAHLKSEISLQAEDPLTLEEIIARIHPTPALGVSPQARSLEILEKLERLLPREELGAPFGLSLSESQAQILVTIRFLKWQDRRVILPVGGGLLSASQEQTEWQELAKKKESVKGIFSCP